MASSGSGDKPKKTRPKMQLLPSMDLLLEAEGKNDSVLKDLTLHSNGLVRVPLQEVAGGRLKQARESDKICWLIATRSLDTVAKVCTALQQIPVGVTKKRRVQAVQERAGVTVDEAEFMSSFITKQCPSMVKLFQVPSDSTPIFGPPVDTCYGCGGQLVSNHSCQVKVYTCEGAKVAEKLTTRCMNCNLYYGYAQYGNKREVGFRYYPEEREAVEVTDGVYFDRRVLDLQCSFA